MPLPYVPMYFDNLTIQQMQNLEYRAIHTNNNLMRFDALAAARGDRDAGQRVMVRVQHDPTWIADPEK